jgi:hypothetical protein
MIIIIIELLTQEDALDPEDMIVRNDDPLMALVNSVGSEVIDEIQDFQTYKLVLETCCAILYFRELSSFKFLF